MLVANPDVVIQCDQQTLYGQRKWQRVCLNGPPMASKKQKIQKKTASGTLPHLDQRFKIHFFNFPTCVAETEIL